MRLVLQVAGVRTIFNFILGVWSYSGTQPISEPFTLVHHAILISESAGRDGLY